MPATHRVESITFNPASLDDFIRALRTIGFTVKQEVHTLDNVEYTYYAKWPHVPFEEGIYFYYVAEHTEIVNEQEVHYNSSINGRVSTFTNYSFSINGRQQHSETSSYVYKIPYILTSDNGIIIRGLNYYEEFNTSTQRTSFNSSGMFFFAPSSNIDSGWDFCLGDYIYVYQGTSPVSILNVIGGKSFAVYNRYHAGEKNLFAPWMTNYDVGLGNQWWITTMKYSFVSHRIFGAQAYGDGAIANGSMGSIFKDVNNDEYYVLGTKAIKL